MGNPTEKQLEEMRERLAARLKEIREYLELSQQDAAEAAGLTRLAISAIETNRRRVESLELQALAKAYGQSIAYFLEDEAVTAEDADIAHLAREAKALSDSDRSELLRFAQFLRGYQSDSSAKSRS